MEEVNEGSALMYAASLRLISPRRCTFIFMVAEQRTVVRRAGRPGMGFEVDDVARSSSLVTIPRISSSNPNSISLSPSSSTSHRTLLTSSTSVFARWSANLPGVATRIFNPFLNRAFSDFFFSPPITVPATIQCAHRSRLSRTTDICLQSSRVGARMMAKRPESRWT